MIDLIGGKRLQALSLWVGVVVFSAILYLTGSYWKAVLIGIFALGSCVVGFGRRCVIRVSFAIAIVAVAVALGAPTPDLWPQYFWDARQAFLDWFRG